MIDFSTLQGLTIPEGVVTQIAKDGVVLWKLETNKPVILEVEKITSDTYAGSTTYTAEEFILLDIYPKTNGTVNVTYGGLTKTITDTSGAEEPNAQQVFFGTFNGVSDSVTTPTSGTLTIEGDCRGFGCSSYKQSSKNTLGVANYCSCIDSVTNFGGVNFIPDYAFANCVEITSLEFSNDITIIGMYLFYLSSSLTNVKLPNKLKIIGDYAFSVVPLTSVEIPKDVTSIGANAFLCSGENLKIVKMLPSIPPTLGITNNTSDGQEPYYGNFGNVQKENLPLEQIIVPKGCGNTYKTAIGWSTYADYIVEES